jgi:hypothetical protein
MMPQGSSLAAIPIFFVGFFLELANSFDRLSHKVRHFVHLSMVARRCPQ